MIRELPRSEGAFLAFEVTGKVDEAEERRWIARFEEAIAEHGRVSALVVLGEGARWGMKAGYEDVKWLVTHMKKLHRIAIVTDSTVWKWLIAFDSPFAKLFRIGEKHFERDELERAWDWLRE